MTTSQSPALPLGGGALKPALVASHAPPQVLLPRQPRVVLLTSAAAARPFLPAWEGLAAEALEPNAFHEPWALLPAIESFELQEGLELLLIFSDAGKERSLLTGVFPLRRQPRYQGLPLQSLTSAQHAYGYLGTPLIRRGCARECLHQLFDWLRSEAGAPLLELARISADGPFYQALTDVLNERACLSSVRSCHTRALFRPSTDGDSYITAALRLKRRKELQRLEKRLGEAGALRYEELGPGDDATAWAAEFMALEAKGWKGEARTAFASREVDRRYLEALTAAAFQRGRLMMLALRLDGKPVAMKYNILAGPGSFAFKIAYDEAFARYSPGVLLELENIRRLHLRGDLAWMDSGACAEHPMINRLWPERRTMKTLLIAPGQAAGELVLSALPMWRFLKRRLHTSLRAKVAAAPDEEAGGASEER